MKSPSKAGPPSRQARGLIAFPSNTGAVCIRPGRQGAVLSWCATYTSLSVLLGRKTELFRSSVFFCQRIVNISAFGGKASGAAARWKFRRKKKREAGFFFRSKTRLARRPREEQEKARGEVLGRDAVQCVGLGRVPRSRAAMSASKGFYRTVCRYLPTLMEMYKLDELTTIRTLQHNIKQKFYENKTIKDPNVSQREGDWGREEKWRRSADRPSACALEVPFWTGPDRTAPAGREAGRAGPSHPVSPSPRSSARGEARPPIRSGSSV